MENSYAEGDPRRRRDGVTGPLGHVQPGPATRGYADGQVYANGAQQRVLEGNCTPRGKSKGWVGRLVH
jgi:hypothetical protein